MRQVLGLKCVSTPSSKPRPQSDRHTKVAVSRTQPGGRVIGIDIIPAQPPTGVSTIQGNFLDPGVQQSVRAYVQDPARGRPRPQTIFAHSEDEDSAHSISVEE